MYQKYWRISGINTKLIELISERIENIEFGDTAAQIVIC